MGTYIAPVRVLVVFPLGVDLKSSMVSDLICWQKEGSGSCPHHN